MSHLRLGGKVVALAAGELLENGSVSVPPQWAALRAAHASVGQIPTSQILVPRRGLEPPPCYGLPPQGSVYTNFTTWA